MELTNLIAKNAPEAPALKLAPVNAVPVFTLNIPQPGESAGKTGDTPTALSISPDVSVLDDPINRNAKGFVDIAIMDAMAGQEIAALTPQNSISPAHHKTVDLVSAMLLPAVTTAPVAAGKGANAGDVAETGNIDSADTMITANPQITFAQNAPLPAAADIVQTNADTMRNVVAGRIQGYDASPIATPMAPPIDAAGPAATPVTASPVIASSHITNTVITGNITPTDTATATAISANTENPSEAVPSALQRSETMSAIGRVNTGVIEAPRTVAPAATSPQPAPPIMAAPVSGPRPASPASQPLQGTAKTAMTAGKNAHADAASLRSMMAQDVMRPADSASNILEQAQTHSGISDSAELDANPAAPSQNTAQTTSSATTPFALNHIQPAAVQQPVTTNAATPLPQSSIPVPLDSQFAERISQEIAMINRTERGIALQVTPERLGTINIEIMAGENGDMVRLTAQDPEIRQLILQTQAKIEQDMRQAGQKIASFEVTGDSASDRSGHNQNGESQTADQNSRQQERETRLRDGQGQQQYSGLTDDQTPVNTSDAGRVASHNIRYA